MIRSSLLAALAVGLSTSAMALPTNTGFVPEAAFDEVSPPTGWDLRDQEARALISRAAFALSGENVFRFESLQRGFGDNKLEQCVALESGEDFDFGIWLRTPTPSEALALRLNVEFYAGEADCLSRDERNGNIGNDDFDFDLDIPANVWTRFGSDSYSADDLSDAGTITHARISYRVRDRSGEEGEPAIPLTQVYLDGAWVNGGEGPANAGFDEVSYPDDLSFAEGSGPIGWILRDLAGLAFVSQVDFARSNGTVFWFEQLERGFGDNKLDQCVALPSGTTEATISTWVMTMEPNDDLRVRFASEFYASQADCLLRENQIGERFDTDVRINTAVADEGEWGRIESDPVVFADDLPEAPAYLRISLRARDRTDDGESAGSILFFDDIDTNLANPVVSGAWFDPVFEGEGLNLQQAPSGLFGYWYGYDDGQPLWLQIGLYDGPIVFGQDFEAPVYRPAGGVFGDPIDELPPIWGRLVIRFDSCTTAQATLSGDSGSQSYDLIILGPIDGVDLENCRSVTETENPAGLSAAWFEPATSGQGWNFVYTPAGLLIYFYGYDADGVPLWLVNNVKPVSLGETVSFDLLRGRGGDFGAPVSSTELEMWGTVEMTFDSCEQINAVISGEDGSQEQGLVVLAPTVGVPGC